MASTVLRDAKIYLGGYDFSAQMSAVALEHSAEMLDETTFGQVTRINKGGLQGIVGSCEGLWDSTEDVGVDPVQFARVGGAKLPVILSPDGGQVGERAYLFESVTSEYSPGGAVGELLRFSLSMEGGNGQPLVQGQIMQTGSESGDVTGTAFQLGAVSAAQHIYAALQVFSGDGDFTAKLQSDTEEAFGDDPTDRITFTEVDDLVAIASEWARLAGAITHTWWRVVATNPSTRNFVVAVGIK